MPVHPYKLLRAVRPGERDITRPIRVGDPPRRPMLPLPPRWPIVHPPVTPTPQRRYPWRSMTLCIAASAGADRISLFSDNRIILAFDRKIGPAYASAEIGYKMAWLNHEWAALYAAEDVSIAQELIGVYKEHLDGWSTAGMSDDAVMETLRHPPLVLKQRRGENYVQSAFGITYANLLEPGRVEIPESQRQQILNEVAYTHHRLGCQLIIAGFVGDNPRFFFFDGLQPSGPAELTRRDHFIAIGVGAEIVEANLYRRKHESRVPLELALYHVYESQRIGQVASSVGREIVIAVLEPGKSSVKAFDVAESGMRFLEKQFKKFGQRRPSISTLPDGFFH